VKQDNRGEKEVPDQNRRGGIGAQVPCENGKGEEGVSTKRKAQAELVEKRTFWGGRGARRMPGLHRDRGSKRFQGWKR